MKKSLSVIISTAIATLFTSYLLAIAAPITPITGGGTGTSTIPGNGQILIGNGTGYVFIASSSLGGSGGGSSTVLHGVTPIVVSALSGGNQTSSCPTCQTVTSTITASGTTLTGPAFTFGSSTYILLYASGTELYATVATTSVSQWNNNSGYVGNNCLNVVTPGSGGQLQFLCDTLLDHTNSNMIELNDGIGNIYVSSAGDIKFDTVHSLGSLTVDGASTFSGTSTFNANVLIIPTSTYIGTNASGVIIAEPQPSTSTITIGTSTASGVFNVTSSGNKAFTITIPSAHDQFYAPSTTIPTNNNQLVNGNAFITAASSVTWTAAITHTATTTFASTTILSGTVSSTEKSALILANASGVWGAYGGASACAGTNNFVTTLSAVGGTSCAGLTTNASSGIQISTTGGILSIQNIGVTSLSLNGGTAATGTVALNNNVVSGDTYTTTTVATSGTNSTTTIKINPTLASSSLAFNFYTPTTTAGYNLAYLVSANQKTIASVDCADQTATSTISLYYATSSANAAATKIASTTLASLICGTAGNSTTSFNQAVLPAGDYLMAVVTSTAGTPTHVTVNVQATKQ